MAVAAHLLQSELSPEKMAAATLPLSPTASSHDGQMPQGFDELVHHNNATSYPREQVDLGHHAGHSSSQPSSRMSTPAPHAMSPHPSPYGLSQQQQQSVYANNYAYRAQSVYDSNDAAYPSLAEEVSPEREQKSEMNLCLQLIASASIHYS